MKASEKPVTKSPPSSPPKSRTKGSSKTKNSSPPPSGVVATRAAVQPKAVTESVPPASGVASTRTGPPAPVRSPSGYTPPPLPDRGPDSDRPQAIFKAGDKAVHPSHGVGEVVAIEKREIGGTTGLFYVLRILDNGMKVMVPIQAALQVGLREVMSEEEADAILETMRAREVAVDVQPWSRRFRIYTEMIKSKSPQEVAKVLRDMHRLKFDKDLSFGERRLLDQAKSLLMKELSLAKNVTEPEMTAVVAQIFTA